MVTFERLTVPVVGSISTMVLSAWLVPLVMARPSMLSVSMLTELFTYMARWEEPPVEASTSWVQF